MDGEKNILTVANRAEFRQCQAQFLCTGNVQGGFIGTKENVLDARIRGSRTEGLDSIVQSHHRGHIKTAGHQVRGRGILALLSQRKGRQIQIQDAVTRQGGTASGCQGRSQENEEQEAAQQTKDNKGADNRQDGFYEFFHGENILIYYLTSWVASFQEI